MKLLLTNKSMIIVHDSFVCKPGQASKLAKLLLGMMKGSKELVNIMTDMTGQFNRVIMVTKYASLTAYEKSWESYMKNSKEREKAAKAMAGYHDMFLTGSREIYRVW